jgi:hypothetical protein
VEGAGRGTGDHGPVRDRATRRGALHMERVLGDGGTRHAGHRAGLRHHGGERRPVGQQPRLGQRLPHPRGLTAARCARAPRWWARTWPAAANGSRGSRRARPPAAR